MNDIEKNNIEKVNDNINIGVEKLVIEKKEIFEKQQRSSNAEGVDVNADVIEKAIIQKEIKVDNEVDLIGKVDLGKVDLGKTREEKIKDAVTLLKKQIQEAERNPIIARQILSEIRANFSKFIKEGIREIEIYEKYLNN